MKISKSKRQLAQLLIEVGVTKFPDGANWAAQDKSGKEIYCYKNKPRRPLGWRSWHHDGGVVSNGEFQANALIANWHQTVLSSDEFDQIVADAVRDADGWIEWKGGECPVDIATVVDVRQLDSHEYTARAVNFHWLLRSGSVSVAAYRQHKPEQAKPEFCESVMGRITEPEAKQTIEQLAADYRNAKDYAERKQLEADAAKVDADAKLKALELAGAAIWLSVSPITAKQEPEMVITDWRDLQVGDEIEYLDGGMKHKIGMIGAIDKFDHNSCTDRFFRIKDGYNFGWPTKWRFIRRP